MARDPDEGDAFVFELVDDDAAVDAAPGAPASPGHSPVPGRKRRAAAQVAAVLAVVLRNGLAVDSMRDHVRSERMRDVRGGVSDLSSPLGETWAWSGAVGPGGGTADVAVLDDVLALESGEGLVGLDPATGEEAWTVPLREAGDCGPMVPAAWGDPAAASLVCLQGTGADRAAVVVGPDGATSDPRPLDPADSRRYGLPHTGPDGTVLRARRVGPASVVDVGDAECTGVGECSGTVEDGRDLVLRAEDAATGEERWSVTVPFRATDAMQCARSFGGSWGSSQNRLVLNGQLAPDTFGARVTAGLIELSGCGIQAAVTPDGVVLGTGIEPGRGRVVDLGTEGYAGISYDTAARATLYAADGDVVGEITGYPLDPQAIDLLEADTLLAVDEPGRRLRAYEPDGTPRWDITLQSGGQEFLVQVGDTAVITTGAGSVRALDLDTGEEAWSWDGTDPASGGDGGYFGRASVVQAFTDGVSLLLLTEGESGRTQGLVTLDLDSGAALWDRPGGGAVTTFDPTERDPGEPGVVGGLVAVDGHLLEVTPRGVRGLG